MIQFNSLVNMGAAGSPFGSEILLNILNGPNYISQSSVPQLATQLPGLFYINEQNVGIALQYTPDSGTTWRTFASTVSATMAYLEPSGSHRFFNGTGVTQQVFLVKIKPGIGS